MRQERWGRTEATSRNVRPQVGRRLRRRKLGRGVHCLEAFLVQGVEGGAALAQGTLNRNSQGVDSLAGEKGTGCRPRLGGIVCVGGAVDFVLRKGESLSVKKGCSAVQGGQDAYIVVVGCAHFESPIPARAAYADSIVANNVLEGVASSPMVATAADIAVHGVAR